MKYTQPISITAFILGVLLVIIYWLTDVSSIGLIGYIILFLANISVICNALLRKANQKIKKDNSP